MPLVNGSNNLVEDGSIIFRLLATRHDQGWSGGFDAICVPMCPSRDGTSEIWVGTGQPIVQYRQYAAGFLRQHRGEIVTVVGECPAACEHAMRPLHTECSA